MAFAPSRTGAPVHLRLAVLTANYSYTSARQQLELVWVVDLPLVGSARVEDRADVAAAGAFVETLLALLNDNYISPSTTSTSPHLEA
jgi:hypothetical protein